MTPIDEQAYKIVDAWYSVNDATANAEERRQLIADIATALRQQWEDCADALASRMTPEGVSTDDMVWKFIEECRQRATGER